MKETPNNKFNSGRSDTKELKTKGKLINGVVGFFKLKPVKAILITIFTLAGTILLTFFLAWFFLFGAAKAQEILVKNFPLHTFSESSSESADLYKNVIAKSQKELQKLNSSYAALTPSQPYLLINTTKNHFFLFQNKELIREGFCSSGSYIQLKSNDDREWTFKTPKGMRTVKGKTKSPVWRKPDWAFIEEGLPVPSATHQSRYEAGVLGDYALSLGDGYLIHGTIYKRFLGMPVTHGCVRLADDDLEQVYNTLNIGSKVYIY